MREQRGGEHPVRARVHGREERGAGVLRGVRHQVDQSVVEPVGVRGELGAAQGSAGVEDGDGFVRSRGGHAVGARVRALGCQGQQVGALLLAGPEAEQCGDVDAAAGRVGGPPGEERVGDHGARPGLLDERGEFAGPRLGWQEHDAAADEMDGELYEDGVDTVGQKKPHSVAGREPLPAQRMPQPEQLSPGFPSGQPLRPLDERLGVLVLVPVLQNAVHVRPRLGYFLCVNDHQYMQTCRSAAVASRGPPSAIGRTRTLPRDANSVFAGRLRV